MKTLMSIICASLFATCAYATPSIQCDVKSARYPELRSGINASTICGETLRELDKNGLISNSDAVKLTEAGRSFHQVNLKINIKSADRTTVKKLAVLSWWPGGDVQVELVEELPPQYIYVPVRTDENYQDRP